ncbi:50S ribosomal protein L22 [Patescibacteria group bacterium]
MTKAKLSNYRQSPRKVRLLADLIRGKDVEKVLQELSFLNKKASLAMKKLVQSAVANAKDKGGSIDNLFVSEVRVDAGPAMKRWRAGARGRAFPFKRRTSHISLTLDSKK